MLKSFIVLFCSVFLGQAVLAAELKPLLIAVNSIEYPPYEYVEHEKLIGLHIEMVRMVAEIQGFSVKFVQLPRLRILKLMKNGEVDGVTFIGKSQAQFDSDLTWFHWGNGLSVSAARLLVLKDSKLRYRGKRSELDGLTLGVLRGFEYGEGL
jgi:hypothetical protein